MKIKTLFSPRVKKTETVSTDYPITLVILPIPRNDLARVILIGLGLTYVEPKTRKILLEWVKGYTDIDPKHIPAFNSPPSSGSLFKGVEDDILYVADGQGNWIRHRLVEDK